MYFMFLNPPQEYSALRFRLNHLSARDCTGKSGILKCEVVFRKLELLD